MTIPSRLRERVRDAVEEAILEGLRRERPGQLFEIVEPDARYRVIRFCFNDQHPDHKRTIATGLTLDEAQAHCSDPTTHGEDAERGAWFDGYDHE